MAFYFEKDWNLLKPLKGFQFMSYCEVVGGRLPEIRQKILAPNWDESEGVSHLVISDSLQPHGL